jgi:hypothetical protein
MYSSQTPVLIGSALNLEEITGIFIYLFILCEKLPIFLAYIIFFISYKSHCNIYSIDNNDS